MEKGFSAQGYGEEAIKRILGPEGSHAKVVIVAAHQDDEAIGTGALLKYLKNVWFVHVTDGAARNMRAARARGFKTREGYALARRAELGNALDLMPAAPNGLIDLGVPDLDACRNLPYISRRLAAIFLSVKPDAVLTHPYEGGHQDHDSAAFAVFAAIELMKSRGAAPPMLLEFTSYHASQNGGISVSKFLMEKTPEAEVRLSETEKKFKEEMFACYLTQKGALRNFPAGVEKFRQAPLYDFSRPPHGGRLFYQHFDWGLPGGTWCRLAAKASRRLSNDCPGIGIQRPPFMGASEFSEVLLFKARDLVRRLRHGFRLA